MRSLLILALGAIACGPTQEAGSPSELPSRMREVASPKVCLAKRRLLEELGHGALAAEAAKSDAKPELEPEIARGPAPPIEVAYGQAAPATVLIRTSSGMGSGVVIDPRGLVLTNQHVIDEFLQLDLTVKVTLELGTLGPTGRVVPSGEPLEGVVVASDAVKDLALVKLVAPPKGLVVAPLAPIDPRVGETVLSIGNAGIGMLWAAKVCNVSRVGDLTRETSLLEAGDCSLRDPLDQEEEASRREQQCEAAKKDIQKHVETALQGVSIQTTCSLNGGDSGGPLVNAWGEVVGLNQSLRFGGGTLAFHVHVAEIRQFLESATLEPAPLVPDPFCEGGIEFQLEDYDGDGVAESAIAVGYPWFDGDTEKTQGAYLFDTDQDDHSTPPSAERPFDADVAILLKGDDAYALYDRNGDGAFDLLVRDRKADGKPEQAFVLQGRRVVPATRPLPEHTIDGALLPHPSHLARLGTVASGAGIGSLASPATLAWGGVPAVPDVSKVAGKEGSVDDVDGDGVVDMVTAYVGAGASSLVIDRGSKALAALKPGDDARPVLEPWALRPQLVLLRRLAGTWALYDTNLDGRLDVALFSRKPRFDAHGATGYFAPPDYSTDAFTIDGDGKRHPIDDHVGRSLVRADLYADLALQNAIRHLRAETRGGFPDAFENHRGLSSVWVFRALSHDRQVLERSNAYGHVALIDLDRDTKNRTTRSAQELANDGQFDAEVIMIRLYDRVWVYHDTNGDGVMDLVTFSRNVHSEVVDAAFTLDPSGQEVKRAATLGGLLRASAVGAGGIDALGLALLLKRVRSW